MPQSAPFVLNAQDKCQLEEISAVWRLNHPKATKDEVMLAIVETTNATSFHEGIRDMHAILVQSHAIPHSKCGATASSSRGH